VGIWPPDGRGDRAARSEARDPRRDPPPARALRSPRHADLPGADDRGGIGLGDCIKTLGERFRYAYAWHFQDVDICAPFDVATPCADGNCVSAQIARMKAKLADRGAPLADRVQALAFLVHFVGDLVQPLHAGEHHDQGGNQVPAAYGVIEGRANLHSVWDGLLADRAISTPPGGAMGLLRGITAAEKRAMRAGTIEDWSRDSWQVSRDVVYASVIADPCGTGPQGRVRFDEAKIAALTPVLRLQVVKGGERLARLLDEALGGR
jgi:hypothetical protein